MAHLAAPVIINDASPAQLEVIGVIDVGVIGVVHSCVCWGIPAAMVGDTITPSRRVRISTFTATCHTTCKPSLLTPR
eukprot:gene4288-biopygen8685